MASSSPLAATGSAARRALRILQVGDLHLGAPARPELVAALERLLARERFDAVVFCGDFAQRARIGEFVAGAALVRYARQFGATISVPGNHDIAWWRSPLHVFGAEPISRKYRRWLEPDLEPVLQLPGATFVGLNTAQGVALHTLTRRPRDIAVVGAVTDVQLARCTTRLHGIPTGDLRAVVMHHNPVRGDLSQRFGFPNHRKVLAALAAARSDLVLAGHDHQERIEPVTIPECVAGERTVVVSLAGTLSNRSRGDRPCSVTAITVDQTAITLQVLMANDAGSAFEPAQSATFPRAM